MTTEKIKRMDLTMARRPKRNYSMKLILIRSPQLLLKVTRWNQKRR